MKAPHELVRALFGVHEQAVGAFEFLRFEHFVAERLHHAHAAKGVLDTRIDARHGAAILGENDAFAIVDPCRIGCHNHGAHKHD